MAALSADALRRRWRALVGRPLPVGLGRSLALRILAYREQARRFGDLDLVSQRALAAVLTGRAETRPSCETDAADGKEVPSGAVMDLKASGTGVVRGSPDVREASASRSADGGKSAGQSILVPPGTVLVREHAGTVHRVMAMDDGFAWNGRTYESLSKVAHAITGTRWNGPRFFGLRSSQKDKPVGGGRTQTGMVRPDRASPGPLACEAVRSQAPEAHKAGSASEVGR